jgi:hypothetical protein
MMSFKIAKCPAEATVVVVDGRGRRLERKVDCDSDEVEKAAQPDVMDANNLADESATPANKQ